MNAWNIKEEVVIIKTFDEKEYIVKTNIRDWNALVWQAEKSGQKKIFLKDYNENLYFSTIKNEKWKTLYKSLPEPVKTTLISMSSTEKQNLKQNNPVLYNKMNAEENEARQKRNKTIKEILEKSLETRKKKFLEEREMILKKLAITEKNFWLTTTIDKLKDAEKYKKDLIKKIF